MNDSRRFLSILVILVIVGGTLAMSKSNDAFILSSVGRKAGEKITNAMPETEKIAGPLNAIRTGTALPVAERVRLRIHSDKGMEGSQVTVTADDSTVTLRGVVTRPSQRIRAIEIAQSTLGVDKVINEIAE